MLPLLGEPMLARQIERLRRCARIDRLILATSIEPTDDPLETLAGQLDFPCYRGSLDDVLDRFYNAAKPYNPEHVVRLTGDCPLSDPEIIDTCILEHIEKGNDYTSNIHPSTYPDGLDVEVFKFRTLKAVWQDADTAAEREHVTLFIYQHPEWFQIGTLRNETNHSGMRWTVDEPEDFEFVTQVYEALYPGNPAFGYADVIKLLKKMPALEKLNRHHNRNSNLQKPVEKS